MTNTTAPTKEYLSCAETAKLVRAALKREFPGQKFSVRSHTYSGGASIDVRWTDGPTDKAVNEVVQDFAGGRFDGMIDLKYHAEHWLTPDGIATVRKVYGHSYNCEGGNETITPDMPDGARLVSMGADFVFTQRDLTPEKVAEIRALRCSRCGAAPGEKCNVMGMVSENSHDVREYTGA